MQALSKKKTGDICTIKWMFGIPDVLDFLRSRKIKEGSTVQVIQRINGGLILGMDGKRIAMCDVAADRIQVMKGRKIKMSGTLEKEPLILISKYPLKEFS